MFGEEEKDGGGKGLLIEWWRWLGGGLWIDFVVVGYTWYDSRALDGEVLVLDRWIVRDSAFFLAFFEVRGGVFDGVFLGEGFGIVMGVDGDGDGSGREGV